MTFSANTIANCNGARPVVDPDQLLIESYGKAQAVAKSGESLDSQRQ